MKLLRGSLWLIVVLLVLQVIKVLLSRQVAASASLAGQIIGCGQFLLVLGTVFVLLFAFLFRRYFGSRNPFVAGTLFFLGLAACLELLMAWWMHNPGSIPSGLRASYAYYYDYYEEDLLQFDPRYAVYNSDLFYTLKPDTSFTFQNIEYKNVVRTNGLGLRDHDSSLRSPRIACIGDSYTMGWGVGQDDCYPARLRSLMGGGVINMGVPSYGTARELINLGRIDVSRLRWVILQYCSNDASENETAAENHYKLPISSRAEYDRLVRSSAVSGTYFPGKYFLTITNLYWKSLVNKIHPFFNLRWDRTDGLLKQEEQARVFLDLLAHSAIDFKKVGVVVTMMDDYENMNDVFLRTVKRLSSEAPYREIFGSGLKVLDIAPLLDKDDFYILDIHYKPKGYEKIARAIRDCIGDSVMAGDAVR